MSAFGAKLYNSLEGLPLPLPKLFLRQLVHSGTLFHSTLCTHDCSLHEWGISLVTCVECGFVSHFIGSKDRHSNFFHIKLCILEASSHGTHTHKHIFSWGGDRGFM